MPMTPPGSLLLMLLVAGSSLLQPSAAVPGTCPIGCYCSERVVDCSALMEFPMSLPADTTEFIVSHLNVVSIPAYAFSYLANITKVHFVNCNIAQLFAYSFKRLPNVQHIIFDKTVIGNIEGFSFAGLQNVSKIQFSNTRIDRIKPFAFYQLQNVTEFIFYNTHIRNFYSHGFYDNTEFGSLTMQKCNVSDFVTGAFTQTTGIMELQVDETAFWNMHCGVIADLQATTAEFFFTRNTFYCNCSIAWLIHPQDFAQHVYLRGISTCHGPNKLENRTVNSVQFEELGCVGIRTSDPLRCPRQRLVPKPPVLTSTGFSGSGSDGGGDGNGGKGGNGAETFLRSRPLSVIALTLLIVSSMRYV